MNTIKPAEQENKAILIECDDTRENRSKPRYVEAKALWVWQETFLGERIAVSGKTEAECQQKMATKRGSLVKAFALQGKPIPEGQDVPHDIRRLYATIQEEYNAEVQAIRERAQINAGLSVFTNTEPLGTHIEKYALVLAERVKNEKYRTETIRILKLIVKTCNVTTLGALTENGVEDYLLAMKAAPHTKKKHHSAISGFARWLSKRKLIPRNFMALVDIPRGAVVQQLRSLNAVELQSLLSATRARPMRARGQKATLERIGRERALVYKTAIYTGLRRGELASLRVYHLDLEHKPFPAILLPGTCTKNGQDAKLLLLPAFAEELQAWINDTRKTPADRLFKVANRANDLFRLDLAFAGVPEKNAAGHVAHFHSLRKSANMLLAAGGVPPKIRQLFMRHSTIDLTMNTYDDTNESELAQALEAFAKIPLT